MSTRMTILATRKVTGIWMAWMAPLTARKALENRIKKGRRAQRTIVVVIRMDPGWSRRG